MPESLYEHDVLAWSELQVELLRRPFTLDQLLTDDWDVLLGRLPPMA